LFALLTGQTLIHVTPLVLTSLTFQIVVVSFASFLVWFWLLKQYVASGLGIFSFLTPIFGVLFSVILLHERVELNFIVGAVFVFLGIVVMNFFSRRSRT
jgi:drug/metabolite transporter (DMT)-like permease